MTTQPTLASAGAQRARQLLDAYGGPGFDDVAELLDDLACYCIETGKAPITTIGMISHLRAEHALLVLRRTEKRRSAAAARSSLIAYALEQAGYAAEVASPFEADWKTIAAVIACASDEKILATMPATGETVDWDAFTPEAVR